MRIHIVTELEPWILRPWSEALARELPDAIVGCQKDPGADVNLFINYYLYSPVPKLAAAVFTHREQGRIGEVFDNAAKSVDWCFAQCEITKVLLPPHKTSILPLYPTVPAFYKDSIVLGVVAGKLPKVRKRMEWVDDLKAIEGAEVRVASTLSPTTMPAFYDGIDYLVIIASNEGGPQPVLEAMARGKPVIAPNVGYCWEYPVLRYNTKEEMLQLIRRLIMPKDGWKRSAQILLDTLGKLGSHAS